jgi:hypothetical protein
MREPEADPTRANNLQSLLGKLGSKLSVSADSKWSTEMLGTILIVVLILMVIGSLPSWGHSRSWGYYPSSGLGLILAVVVVLLLMGRI